MDELCHLHPLIFDAHVSMIICTFDQEISLSRLERIFFLGYEVKKSSYLSGWREKGIPPITENIIVYFIFHCGNEVFGLQKKWSMYLC